MFDPSVGRTAHVLESADVFAGLADAVLCVVRLCLRKVGVACLLDRVHDQHQCCWQFCWQCAACCWCNVTHASHGSTALLASKQVASLATCAGWD
jgi:hypothetical protein